jgi:acyl phosphate:glycerol-3-phosphate acyltransferase
MTDIFLAFIAYFLGTFPSAFICGKIFRGQDIRVSGSGNVGAMNAAREFGILPGILTLLFDFMKGFLAVYLAFSFGISPFIPLIAALLVVLGHNFNIFLGFKGGKGLASLAGTLILLAPMIIVYMLALYLVLIFLIRDTNTAAGVGIFSLPLFLGFQTGALAGYVIGAAIAVVIFIKHLRDFKAYALGRRKFF